MNKFDGVANTLFVPLVARINISKKFPEYFMDEKALELEKYLPQGADKGSSEYSNMASVARYYNMDKTVTAFAKSYAEILSKNPTSGKYHIAKIAIWYYRGGSCSSVY